jgi:hypothetical protein
MALDDSSVLVGPRFPMAPAGWKWGKRLAGSTLLSLSRHGGRQGRSYPPIGVILHRPEVYCKCRALLSRDFRSVGVHKRFRANHRSRKHENSRKGTRWIGERTFLCGDRFRQDSIKFAPVGPSYFGCDFAGDSVFETLFSPD